MLTLKIYFQTPEMDHVGYITVEGNTRQALQKALLEGVKLADPHILHVNNQHWEAVYNALGHPRPPKYGDEKLIA